ncbi:MAG TPA: cyclic nucleotide-binding domain-containing protein [Deltaproteobacteria bacterium]|nr:cyclic nucleotide-binding domain-containing protein [Deltaproteobacteria bacterium]
MKQTRPIKAKDWKSLLKQARQAALKGKTEKAYQLFDTCIKDCLSCRMPLKAIAAAKYAKTVLGPTPKIRAILIRLFISAGLHGDAQQEYDECCRVLMKDSMAVLKELHMEAFLDVLAIIDIVHASTGQCIFKQNDPGQDIYIVLSGEFDILRDGATESLLRAGALFGELGFFHHQRRSATARATRDGELMRIPAEKLHVLREKHPCLKNALEEIYDKRMLKKASEDMRSHPVLDVYTDHLRHVSYAKGQVIPSDTTADVTIIKHGVVEINYDEKGVLRKRFLKPGSIIERFSGTAKANTDVELVIATIDLLGHYR